MKTKFILPIIAIGLFAACSGDNSTSTGAEEGDITESADSVEPESSDSESPRSSATEFAPGSSSATADTKVTYRYYGAELSGKEKFKYGRFEARMKMVSFSGTVSSMFLYYNDSYELKDKPWNEIDIEVIGTSKTKWQSNIITREGDPSIAGTTTTETVHDLGFDATEDFHLYGIIWTPEYVAWEIDSVEVRRVELGTTNGTHADSDQVAFLTEEETLRFNLWSSKSAAWTGKFTGEELADGPAEQVIDYVRVYSYDEGTKNFTLNWQDDFNSSVLSGVHWKTGNWEMENVRLAPENVVVEDGFCKLLMTREAIESK
jgi:hypothetical protein